MSESETTLFLKKAIISCFQNKGIKLNQEVRCRSPKKISGKGIIDLAGLLYGDSVGIEIKVNKSDFYHGSGMNFVCNFNYLAVPTHMSKFALDYLNAHKLNYVGVIGISTDGCVSFDRECQKQVAGTTILTTERRTKHMQLLVTPSHYKYIKKIADEKGMSLNDIIDRLIRAFIDDYSCQKEE